MSRNSSSIAAGPGAASDAGGTSLSERLAAEMADRWQKGEAPRAEEFLDRHPELWDQPEAAADLIYEEVCLRQERGEAGAAADALARFPQWHSQLEVLFQFHQLLEPAQPAPTFPEVGEALGEFILVSELGRGAVGRVFLASQLSLADRLVVLKLTPQDGREHLSLARLQHTNIVPVHSVQDDPARHLRVLCMPYFGGVTLARLLADLADQPFRQRTGRGLLERLDRHPAAGKVALPARGAARAFLDRSTYVQAVCWIGAQLADALQYAHDHGLVHLDVKPSNILMAADGQPMLLDFHLAREPIPAGGPALAWLGGTLHYMSPEQRDAMAAVRAAQKVPVEVDGRSDVYSLGLVLYEALGGTFPLPSSGPPPRLERCNPLVSVGLADIVHKCLASNPRDRYPTAGLLATDLRRHLTDLPLKGTRNRSLRERWQKLRRRRPHVLKLGAMAAAVLLAAGAVAWFLTSVGLGQLAEARNLLQTGVELRQQGQFEEANEAFERGRKVALTLPFNGALVKEFEDEQERARIDKENAAAARVRERAVQQLHDFVDALRLLYAASTIPPRHVDELLPKSDEWWRQRRHFTSTEGPSLPDNVQSQVRRDLLDLAILRADLRVHAAPKERKAAAHAKALEFLKAAEAELGSSPVLLRERQHHARAAGVTDHEHSTDELTPRTAWEHYALGRSLLRENQPEKAAVALRKAVRLEPDGLWPNFYLGVCTFRLGQHEEAVAAFSVCTALASTKPECFYNRALALTKLKRNDDALADYDRVLDLAPTFAAGALNRGILHFQAKRLDQAAADFQQALKSATAGAEKDLLPLIHYNTALVHQARGDRPAAAHSVEQALQLDPSLRAAHDLKIHLAARR